MAKSVSEKSKNNAEQYIYETIKAEYDFTGKQIELLQNRVLILITVCAFIFTPFVSLAGKFKDIPALFFMLVPRYSIVFLIYLLDCILYVFTTVRGLFLIRSFKLERIWVKGFMEADLFNEKYRTSDVVRAICEQYEKSDKSNSEEMVKRFKGVKSCYFMLAVCFIVLSILYFLVYFVI